jgi:carboxymethylenebutenolidase
MILKTFFSLLLSGIIFNVFAQEKSCCDTEKDKSFTAFSNQKEFLDTHQIPEKFTLKDAIGKMITFKTKDGKTANAYFVKSTQKTNKYIFVFHEWWGLNDFIKKESDELQKKLGAVNILAIDLYDGNVAKNREEAAKYMQSVNKERAFDIIKGAIDYVGKHAEVGTLGWCFGGGWSLQASIMLGKHGKACVMYYGIIENTPATFKNLDAPVLGIFATKDAWITPTIVQNLEKNLKDAGKQIIAKSFDADHAFANPSNSSFNEKATNEAKKLTIKFFKENLMQ